MQGGPPEEDGMPVKRQKVAEHEVEGRGASVEGEAVRGGMGDGSLRKDLGGGLWGVGIC